jgi:hypothetical protein
VPTVLMAERWRRLPAARVGCGSVMVVLVARRLMGSVVSVVRRACSAMVAPVVRAWMVVMVAPAVLVAGGWVSAVMAVLVVPASTVVLVAMVDPVFPISQD